MAQRGAIVLGVRDFSQPQVPWRSRWGNRITSLVFRIFVGMTLSDTQTGLRAIPAGLLSTMTAISGDRFEYETNMLLEMKAQGLPYCEQTIRTVYIEENQSSHFRAVRDSWRIYKLILAHFFRYTLSSVASFLLDEGLFMVLGWLLAPHLTGFALTAVPTALARLASSLFNFFVNKRLVFRKKGKFLQDMARYYLLAVPIALAQMGLTYGALRLLGIGAEQTALRGIVYGVVMAVLFVVSFLCQQNWVFRRSHEGEKS
jgi:putative flippase GtrA